MQLVARQDTSIEKVWRKPRSLFCNKYHFTSYKVWRHTALSLYSANPLTPKELCAFILYEGRCCHTAAEGASFRISITTFWPLKDNFWRLEPSFFRTQLEVSPYPGPPPNCHPSPGLTIREKPTFDVGFDSSLRAPAASRRAWGWRHIGTILEPMLGLTRRFFVGYQQIWPRGAFLADPLSPTALRWRPKSAVKG